MVRHLCYSIPSGFFWFFKLTSPLGSIGLQGNIINLHPCFSIDSHTAKLLSRGLSFIPTNNKINLEILDQDLREFTRRLEWWDFFSNHPHRDSIPAPLSGKSSKFPPSRAVSHETKLACQNILDLKKQVKPFSLSKPNLSESEFAALKAIMGNKELKFCNADKGNAIVILHPRDYHFEAMLQLSNSKFYKPLQEPIFPATSLLITDILSGLVASKKITKKQFNFLKPPVIPRARHFYILPKIHKDPLSWSIPSFLPKGRPIVSGCSSESIGAENLIDFFLKPLAQSQPSYIRDSMDLIHKLNGFKLDHISSLMTCDVESLYTMIDPQHGLEAIAHFFNSSPDPSRPDQEILDLLRICLTRNDFQFNGKWFLQIKGTAMGRIFAPNYACLYLSRWEEIALSRALYSHNLIPSFFVRYIDDIFLIGNFSPQDFVSFLNICNSVDRNIKVSGSHSYSEVNFLDLTLFKSHNKLCSKIYSKPTDTHQLLHFDSFHPRHTFRGILKSQILRFARACDHRSDFKAACATLKQGLLKSNYSRSFFRNVFQDTMLSLNWEKFTIGDSLPKGFGPCLSARCKCCTHCLKSKVFSGLSPASNYLILQSLNCGSKNTVYGISCTLCSPQNIIYVGKSTLTLRDRLNKHRSDISLARPTPVGSHFCSPGHSISNLKIMAIDQSPGEPKLSAREIFWISKLGVAKLPGLNVQQSTHSDQKLPLVLTFNHRTIGLPSQVRTILSSSQLNVGLIPAFRKNKNLAALLAKSKFSWSPVQAEPKVP